MEMNELTEREQHYLNEWSSHQEERPIKALLIISWSSVIIVFLFLAVCVLLLKRQRYRFI